MSRSKKKQIKNQQNISIILKQEKLFTHIIPANLTSEKRNIIKVKNG